MQQALAGAQQLTGLQQVGAGAQQLVATGLQQVLTSPQHFLVLTLQHLTFGHLTFLALQQVSTGLQQLTGSQQPPFLNRKAWASLVLTNDRVTTAATMAARPTTFRLISISSHMFRNSRLRLQPVYR